MKKVISNLKVFLSVLLCAGTLCVTTTSCRPQTAKSVLKAGEKLVGKTKADRAAGRLMSGGKTIQGLTGAAFTERTLNQSGRGFSPNFNPAIVGKIVSGYGNRTCSTCGGSSCISCYACGGNRGFWSWDAWGNSIWVNCQTCRGMGIVRCPDCN